MKHYDEKEKAVRISATYEDFDGNLTKWKDSFYQIWRYQMGYHFAHEIKVIDGSEYLFVSLLVKPSFKSNALAMMGDLGYRNITEEEETVGIVYAFEHEDLEEIDLLVLDY